jgi:hypothetical protein
MNQPLRRTLGLVVEEVAGDTIVYDERSHRAHSLNRTAGEVWRRCDGLTPIEEIAKGVSAALSETVDANIVRIAIGELGRLGLLEGDAGVFAGEPSRRDAVRKMAAAGGAMALLPAIGSIVAPTPAMARSGDYHDSPGGGSDDPGGGLGRGRRRNNGKHKGREKNKRGEAHPGRGNGSGNRGKGA